MKRRYINNWVFTSYKTNGLLWIRIWNGYGLIIKNTAKHTPLFSERNGYTKVLRVGKYSIKLLKP